MNNFLDLLVNFDERPLFFHFWLLLQDLRGSRSYFPFLPLGKTRGIVIIMSVVCLSTFSCKHYNSTKSYPILMKLHRIVLQ